MGEVCAEVKKDNSNNHDGSQSYAGCNNAETIPEDGNEETDEINILINFQSMPKRFISDEFISCSRLFTIRKINKFIV